MATASKSRRPKPVNFGTQRRIRFGPKEESAVSHLRAALAKNRGVEIEKVNFSEAARLLLVENHQTAVELAGRPEAWPTSTLVELPAELWDTLTGCRNALVHARGSMYGILRKSNCVDDGPFTRDEAREALTSIEESKEIIARLEERMVAFVAEASAAADAEADGSQD